MNTIRISPVHNPQNMSNMDTSNGVKQANGVLDEKDTNKHHSEQQERGKSGKWQKGMSGNPLGRPKKGQSVVERFRENATTYTVIGKIVETAMSLGQNNQHPDAMQCAKIVAEKILPSLKAQEIRMETTDQGFVFLPPQETPDKDE